MWRDHLNQETLAICNRQSAWTVMWCAMLVHGRNVLGCPQAITQLFSIHAFITNNGNKTRRLAYCAYRMLLLCQHFINSAACCSYVALSLYRHCIMSGPNVYCKLNALWHFDCRVVASDVKQMPLLFALMSGKSRKDYRAVSTAAYIQWTRKKWQFIFEYNFG